jgi:hypothetical protein
MLSEIGVKAWPAFFSTWSAGEQTDLLPMPFYFDHVILFWEHEGSTYFTDLLLQGYQVSEIPAVLAGKWVFVVNDSGGFFTTIPETDRAESVNVQYQNASIRADGTAFIQLLVVFSRAYSITIKEQLRKMNTAEKETFFATVETLLSGGGKVLERKWQNADKLHGRIFLNLKFERPSFAQHIGDMMIFGVPPTERGSLFVAPTRKNPIVLSSAVGEDWNYSFSVPADYEIVNMPKNISFQNSLISFSLEYAVNGNKITAKKSVIFRKTIIPADQYQTIQNLLDEIPRKVNDKILIRQKKALDNSIVPDHREQHLDDVFSKVAGTWEWKDLIGTERSNPYTIVFTDKNRAAVFTLNNPSKRIDGRSGNTYTYKILHHDEKSITMSLDGETRKTQTGDFVVWTIVLIEPDVYCWRRSDWQLTSCSKPVQLLMK